MLFYHTSMNSAPQYDASPGQLLRITGNSSDSSGTSIINVKSGIEKDKPPMSGPMGPMGTPGPMGTMGSLGTMGAMGTVGAPATKAEVETTEARTTSAAQTFDVEEDTEVPIVTSTVSAVVVETAGSISESEVDPFADAADAADAPTNTGETISEEDKAAYPDIALLPPAGIPIPTLGFVLDTSDEATAERNSERITQYKAEGLPDEVAKLKSQLIEREMEAKATRARHTRKRTIIRLIQDAKLRKNAKELEQRNMIAKMIKDSRQKEMEEALAAKEEADKEKATERKARDEALAAERKKREEEKRLMEEMRTEALMRLANENAERKKSEKQEKREDAKARDQLNQETKENTRKMREDFKAQMLAQLEDNKRLMREERMKEAEEAHQSRLALEGPLGLPKTPLEAIE